MKLRLVLIGLLLAALGMTLTAQQQSDRTVKVMTQNLYSGVDAEIFAVPQAADFNDLLSKVADVYNGYAARDFPSRAARIADEVLATKPDLISLQEAVLVRTQYPPDPSTRATTVQLDFVQILQSALEARGLDYDVVAQSPGFDAELPSALGFEVRHTEREVILSRADLNTSDLKLSNIQTGQFTTNCTIPSTLVGPITLTRSWASVDAKVRGKNFRLVTTHLDPICLPITPAIQLGELSELLSGPGSTNLPLLLTGDFNSPAVDGVTYKSVLENGFTDAWKHVGFGDGFTCCQLPHLDNYPSFLDQRIDFVFTRGPWTPLSATNVGQNLEDRTATGLWPSDHAGLVVSLRLDLPR